MTLTVVVGSSGSGKTTFLNQVYSQHNCIYLRQYHGIRPYIVVKQIPNFDPTQLPYWTIYQNEGTADVIQAGGTSGGRFVAGLSGGQRKLLMFEMICQRCKDQKQLLIVMDEPFAGVTDDFVPFVTERLNKLKQHHNVLLVTNDHVEALKALAENTITVSAIDRNKVKINDDDGMERNLVILALSVGYVYKYTDSVADRRFFWNVEFFSNQSLRQVVVFTVICFLLFVATFWDSDPVAAAALVLIAGGIIAYFGIQPYLATLVEWRENMLEEAEALVHSSPTRSKMLKTTMSCVAILFIATVEFFAVNVVVRQEFWHIKYCIAMIGELITICLPSIILSMFTRLTFQSVSILAGLPFLLVIFFSTTYSPGAGLPGLKALRYLFSRYYFFCMVDSPSTAVEGCPENDAANVFLLLLTSFASLYLLLVIKSIGWVRTSLRKQEKLRNPNHKELAEIESLQTKLYGGDEATLSLCAPGAPGEASFIAAVSSGNQMLWDQVVIGTTDDEEDFDFPTLIRLRPDPPASRKSRRSLVSPRNVGFDVSRIYY